MALKNIVFKINELDTLVSDKKACVKRRTTRSRRLSLMPVQLTDLKTSIRDCLDSEVTTYDERGLLKIPNARAQIAKVQFNGIHSIKVCSIRLGGIILSFKNVKVETLSKDDPGNCMIPVNYQADVYIFKPKVGSILKGVVSKKSSDHIGCLVHRIFNVSIFRPTDIPFEDWTGSSLDIGDEVTFKIDYMDLSSRLPFIRGVLNV